MTIEQKQSLLRTVQERELLRPLSRLTRLLKAPTRTLPYYTLAAASHIYPFPLSFRTLWGSTMTSYLPEGNTFFYYGFCEANVTNFLVRFLKPGDVFFDIGAHIGIYSMLAAELTGPTGVVHAFEPTPRTATLLKRNTRQYPHVQVHQLALGERPGELTFMDYGPGYSAFNTASAEGAQGITKHGTATRVTVTTLDTFLTDFPVHPNLIKIDAEGLEPAILAGAEILLRQKLPRRPLILLEVAGGVAWEKHREQAFKIITNAGYDSYSLSVAGLPTPHTFTKQYVYDNLLFIPSGQDITFTL